MAMLMKNKQRGFSSLHLALYQSSALIHTETPDQLLGAYRKQGRVRTPLVNTTGA